MLVALCLVNVAISSGKQYPFEVSISGKGGTPIIFIPGFSCSGKVWDETKARFEQDHKCYTLTMAGFAGVPARDTASFKQREEALAAYIRDNKIKQPIIVGHSMGGGWAMAMAADYPELVSKIVVVDALPCLAAMYNPNFKPMDSSTINGMVARMVAMGTDDFYKMQMQSMTRLLADSTKMDMVVGWSVKSDRKTFADMYCSFMNTDLLDRLGTIVCPALILLEPSFEPVKDKVSEQFGKLKTADIRFAHKGLHFIMYDDKEWYMEQLNNFIR